MERRCEKKVSIIVPVYNAEKTIAYCVNSIRKQTYENIEIICVNDGSKDKSSEILQELALADKRILVINKQNQGVSAARNTGLSKATGEYVQFVDSDDAIENSMVEEMVSAIENNDAQWVICGYKFSDGQESRIPEQGCCTTKGFWERFNYFYMGGFFCSPWNKLFVKEFINHTFDENMNLGEDAVFNLQYALNISRISIVDRALYLYTVGNTDSLSFRYNPKALICEEKKNSSILKMLKEQSSIKQELLFKQECAKDFIRCIDSEILCGKFGFRELETKIYDYIQKPFWQEIFFETKAQTEEANSKVKRKIKAYVKKMSIVRCFNVSKKWLKGFLNKFK